MSIAAAASPFSSKPLPRFISWVNPADVADGRQSQEAPVMIASARSAPLTQMRRLDIPQSLVKGWRFHNFQSSGIFSHRVSGGRHDGRARAVPLIVMSEWACDGRRGGVGAGI